MQSDQRRKYSRKTLLDIRNNPSLKNLPPGLEPDDLSDLSESVFFDKSTEDIYLGPQGSRFHSRLINHTSTGFDASTSTNTKPQSRNNHNNATTKTSSSQPSSAGRFTTANSLDRWDSNKAANNGPANPAPNDVVSSSPPQDGGGWSVVRSSQRSSSSNGDWRSAGGKGAAGPPPSSNGMQGTPPRGQSGSWHSHRASADGRISSSSTSTKPDSRWVKDAGDSEDWRSRKQSGSIPEPRHDWADSSKSPGSSGGLLHAMQSTRGGDALEWAEGDAPSIGGSFAMTAEDLEEERQRMQAQWRKSKEAMEKEKEAAMMSVAAQELVDDDEIERWRKEQEEEEEKERRSVLEQQQQQQQQDEEQQSRPVAGQHVDVGALFGAGGGPGSQQQQQQVSISMNEDEKVRSRFATFFSLEDSLRAGAPIPSPSGLDSTTGDPNPGRNLLAMLQKTTPTLEEQQQQHGKQGPPHHQQLHQLHQQQQLPRPGIAMPVPSLNVSGTRPPPPSSHPNGPPSHHPVPLIRPPPFHHHPMGMMPPPLQGGGPPPPNQMGGVPSYMQFRPGTMPPPQGQGPLPMSSQQQQSMLLAQLLAGQGRPGVPNPGVRLPQQPQQAPQMFVSPGGGVPRPGQQVDLSVLLGSVQQQQQQLQQQQQQQGGLRIPGMVPPPVMQPQPQQAPRMGGPGVMYTPQQLQQLHALQARAAAMGGGPTAQQGMSTVQQQQMQEQQNVDANAQLMAMLMRSAGK